MSNNARYIAVIFMVLVAFTAVFVAKTNAKQNFQISPIRHIEIEPPIEFFENENRTEIYSDAAKSPSVLSWSKVTFQSARDGNWNIFIGNDDSNGQIRLTHFDTAEIHPNLNRGNTQIVYARKEDDYEIYTMVTDGSHQRPLTANGVDDVHPVWSPDGTKIAFESYRDGKAEVYVMNADGSNQQRLTIAGDFNGMPTWSPDGNQIAFVSHRTGGFRIWVMDADGTNQTQLSNLPYSFRPQWSPDGNLIAFDADNDGDGWQDLWSINVDGSGLKKLYDPQGMTDAWAGSWSPDGRFVSFTKIAYIIYHGNLYWTEAFIDAWDRVDNKTIRLGRNGVDWNPQWQTTDNQKPESSVRPLPAETSAKYAQISWEGEDIGSAGIARYDIQYRLGAEGVWQDWFTATAETTSPFPATPGTTVYFRSRVRDYAYNWESWPADPDTYATFYAWQFAGNIVDNRGVSLQNKTIQFAPSTIQPVVTNAEGDYHGLTRDFGAHTLSMNTPHYGLLEDTLIEATHATNQAFYLSPQDNLLLNSSFEEGDEQPVNWQINGDLPTNLVNIDNVSGENALVLGSACPEIPSCTTLPIDFGIEEFFRWRYMDNAVAVDKHGNLHVLWRVRDYPDMEIYHSERFKDGTWQEPTLVYRGPSVSNALEVRMEFDSKGTLHAVWVDTEGPKHASKLEGGAWTIQAVYLGVEYDSNYNIDDFDIAPNDGLHLLFQGGRQTDFNGLFHIEKLPNGEWQNSQQVWWEYVNTPRLAIGPDNSLHISWQKTHSDDPAGDFLLFYRVRSPGGIWQPREILLAGDGLFASDVLDLSFDPHGNLHLLTEERVGYQDFVLHMIKRPGYNWDTPFPLDYWRGYWDWGFDSQGTLHLIYSAVTYTDKRLVYRQYTQENGWTDPVDLETDSVDRDILYLEIDPNDSFHLITLEMESVLRNYYQEVLNSESNGSAFASQEVTFPAEMQAPTLTFMVKARRDWADDETQLLVSVSDGISETAVFSQTLFNEWQQYWVDLSNYRGETATVTFELFQSTDAPSMQIFLDDVTLGSAHPDMWLDVAGPGAAKPGTEFDFHVTYGNRGALDVETATITLDLPPEFIFKTASIEPISLSPLQWEVGNLFARKALEPFVITVDVANSATSLVMVASQFQIESTFSEIEVENNTQDLYITIGEQAYMPMISNH